MKTILITGINGFLGSNLAKSLLDNFEIVGLECNLDNLYRLKDTNFKVYSSESGIPSKLFDKHNIDIIIHTATFYGRQNEATKTLAQANLFIPFELLDIAITKKTSLFINTDTVLNRFVSAYALTKQQFQEWLYLRSNEIKVINMKLEHIYGPGASSFNFITAISQRLKNNETNIDLTFGEQMRDFVYIDDVVSAFKTILEKINLLTDDYAEFEVATEQLVSIKELVQYLKILTKSKTNLNFGAIPYRNNELMRSKADISHLVKLGWTPSHSIKEGLEKTI